MPAPLLRIGTPFKVTGSATALFGAPSNSPLLDARRHGNVPLQLKTELVGRAAARVHPWHCPTVYQVATVQVVAAQNAAAAAVSMGAPVKEVKPRKLISCSALSLARRRRIAGPT